MAMKSLKKGVRKIDGAWKELQKAQGEFSRAEAEIAATPGIDTRTREIVRSVAVRWHEKTRDASVRIVGMAQDAEQSVKAAREALKR